MICMVILPNDHLDSHIEVIVTPFYKMVAYVGVTLSMCDVSCTNLSLVTSSVQIALMRLTGVLYFLDI